MDDLRFLLHLPQKNKYEKQLIKLLKISWEDAEWKIVRDLHSYHQELNTSNFSGVIFDCSENFEFCSKAIHIFNSLNLRIPFILVSDTIDDKQAMEAILNGADDYVRPSHLGRIVPAMRRELEYLRIQKQKEQASLLFNTVFQNANIGMQIINQKGTIVEVNEKFAETFGFSKEELLGEPITIISVKGKEQHELEKFLQFVQSDQEITEEHQFQRKDGTIVEVLLTSTKFDLGDDIYTFSTALDITEANRQKKILSAAEKLVDLGGWERNLSTGEVRWTDGVYRIHQIDKSQPIPTFEEILEFYEPESKTELKNAVDKIKNDLKPYDLTLKFIGAKGTFKWVRVTANALTMNDELIKLFGTIQDVTQTQNDKELLKESLKEKEVLIKEVHHRVKNNLAVISGLLELQGLSSENDEVIAEFKESQMRIKSIAMIHEMLYQTHLFTSVDLKEYLRQLVKNLKSAFTGPDSSIKCKMELESVTIDVNKAVPFGILINEIITNSFKHAFKQGEEGIIRATLTENNGRIVVSVSDNGKGFDPVAVKKGKSLGINLINSLTQQLNATMELNSGSSGTTYNIYFESTTN